MEKEKILVFEPHPDDVAFQIAGSIAKWIADGKEIMICTVTNGNNSTFDPKVSAVEIEKIMHEEHLVAMKTLGIQPDHLIQWHYDDLNLDPGRDRIPLLRDMVGLIRKFKPMTVITMDPKNMENEENGDHRLVAMTGFEAAAQAAYPNVFPEQLKNDKLNQHFVSRLLFYMTPEPNAFVDISGDPIELKIKIGTIYTSQLELMTTEINQRLKTMGLTPDLTDIPLEELWKTVCESNAEEMAQMAKSYFNVHVELAPHIPLLMAEGFRIYYLGVVEKLSGYLPKEWQSL